jgi:hypothetical protein
LKSLVKNSFIVLLLAGAIIGCNKPPEYPVEPSISFDNVYYRKGDTTNYLILSVNFKDGDGDLGLDSYYYSGEPYNSIWYFVKQDGNLLSYADRNTPPFDTLPPYAFPYSCYNYSVEQSDTLYIQQNRDHYNIFVNFYVKKNGVFQLYDWLTANPPNCGESYNGRFPILNLDSNDNPSSKQRPLEGILKYTMKGLGFEAIFKRDTLKLEVQIQDRALHKSNTVESFEFVLKDITTN